VNGKLNASKISRISRKKLVNTRLVFLFLGGIFVLFGGFMYFLSFFLYFWVDFVFFGGIFVFFGEIFVFFGGVFNITLHIIVKTQVKVKILLLF
jgi:hypothetical protein